VERRELPRDSRSVMPRLPVREISLEASGEEGADEGLQVGDAEVAPHHRLQLLSRILKQTEVINSNSTAVDRALYLNADPDQAFTSMRIRIRGAKPKRIRILVRICVTKGGSLHENSTYQRFQNSAFYDFRSKMIRR
jgi:hypothetical protein